MVYKRVRAWTAGAEPPRINICWVPPPPPPRRVSAWTEQFEDVSEVVFFFFEEDPPNSDLTLGKFCLTTEKR